MSIKDKLRKNVRLFTILSNCKRKINKILRPFKLLWIRIFLKIPSLHIRNYIINCYSGVHIDKNVPIYHGFEWWRGEFVVGKGTSIGYNNHIDCRRGVYIGENVCLASNVCIWTLHHDYNDVNFAVKGGPVTIGNYAWLCSHCIILPGVKIGEGAIVASGAVVVKDVEPWTVVGGIPATTISKRKKKEYQYIPGKNWIHFA